jgi:hypothetical protein
MGCDIHAYVEYADFTTNDGAPYWRNLTRNGGSRNYVMFGVLAGVGYPEAQLFEPKGMPQGRLGWDTSDDDWCSLEQAERWVAGGYSVGETDDNGRLRRVSGPDWHSHSWLTTDELAKALDHYVAFLPKAYPSEPRTVPVEWQAMLAAMRCFEANGKQARLVFWFDN